MAEQIKKGVIYIRGSKTSVKPTEAIHQPKKPIPPAIVIPPSNKSPDRP